VALCIRDRRRGMGPAAAEPSADMQLLRVAVVGGAVMWWGFAGQSVVRSLA